MGYFSEYIDRFANSTFEEITIERKKQLKNISEIRNREILVYASDQTKNARVEIWPPDLLVFKDQLSYVKSREIDILLETPGGIAETVEDMVNLVRGKHDKVGIIIPGCAKSAGTIFAMAGDEILMSESSTLGPIDAQIMMPNGKRFSADAFLDGLEKIKTQVLRDGLNPAYIPILQNISPGEIQHFENAQNFSRTLVRQWLKTYKFKYWETHKSTGLPVTEEEKESRADEIASNLCRHSDWLTHGRSIRINDLEAMRLKISNYTEHPELEQAIERYYNLLRLTFEKTGIYKIFETTDSQIYQSIAQVIPAAPSIPSNGTPEHAITDITCPQCQSHYKVQFNLKEGVRLQEGCEPYPKNGVFLCKTCAAHIDISSVRLQFEAQTGLKVIL